MNRDDIIRMAREAGWALAGDLYGEQDLIAQIEYFAALVAAAEREAYARVADYYSMHSHDTAADIADTIRARGNT